MHTHGDRLLAHQHYAISIPEIVTYVLCFLERNDLWRAALVCHAWSILILPFLWRDLNSLFHLLKILSPLEKVDKVWVSHSPIVRPRRPGRQLHRFIYSKWLGNLTRGTGIAFGNEPAMFGASSTAI